MDNYGSFHGLQLQVKKPCCGRGPEIDAIIMARFVVLTASAVLRRCTRFPAVLVSKALSQDTGGDGRQKK